MSVHEVDSSSPDVDKQYCTCEDVFRFGPDEMWQVEGAAHMFDGSPCSTRVRPFDVQGEPCSVDTKQQAAPCCCGKYRFPTFELDTLDWSWGPITDDDGVHEADRCLFGLREPSVQESGTHPSGIAVEIVGRSFDTIEVAPENVVQWDEQMFTLQVNWDDWCRIERGLDDAFDHTLNTSVDMERTENHELAEWFTTEADLCQGLKHRLIADVEAQQ